jgi:hypothetical protein
MLLKGKTLPVVERRLLLEIQLVVILVGWFLVRLEELLLGD